MSSEICIRPAREEDAEAFLRFLFAFDRESRFMAFEPGERNPDIGQLRQGLVAASRKANDLVLLVLRGDEVVGYLEALGGKYRRTYHRVNVTMGLLDKAAGQGLGKRLLGELEVWAAGNGIERLELSVLADNERALGLYLKMGYAIEGRKQKAMKIDGKFVEGIFMARIL